MPADDFADDRSGEPNGEISLVHCDTTAGAFSMEFHEDWSPIGYERAVKLFDRGFYDHSHFFRVVPHFLVQFGISYTEDHYLHKLAMSTIKDDPQLKPRIKFREGIISFAGSGPNSRSSHLFIAYRENDNLGTELWETPVGRVASGMDVVRSLNHEYGDMPPWGHGPEQPKIHQGGRNYIEANFPNLDEFLTCHVVLPTGDDANTSGDSDEEEPEDYYPEDEEGGDETKEEQKNEIPPKKINALRKKGEEQIDRLVAASDDDESSSHGFEVPVIITVIILLVLFVMMKKRKAKKASKSL